MNVNYWNRALQNYDAEIVSVFDLDANAVVSKWIHELAHTCGRECAADMGCGVGKFTKLLSQSYQRVESCDFSREGVARTQARCLQETHVNVHHMDLTRDPSPFDPVDLVLCINVLMMPSMDERLRAWRTVTNQVRQDGHLLLVVPSIESILMERRRDIEGQLNEGNSCQRSLNITLPEDSTAMDYHQGVYSIDQIRTKHYLKAELVANLEDHHFTVQRMQPLRYRAKHCSETLDTWDWLVLAQRN